MQPIEQQILSHVNKFEYISSLDWEEELCTLPLGALSQEFCEHPLITKYCANTNNGNLRFKLTIEKYIKSDRSQPYLANLEAALLKLPSLLTGAELQDQAAGTYLMPITRELICQIYLLEDPALTALFQKYFPTPPAQLFNSLQLPIPRIVREQFVKIDETMKAVDLTPKFRSAVITTQRLIREKQRHQEELHRIALRDKIYLELNKMSPEGLLQDASTPYKPKCHPELSARIMAAAKKVSGFSTVKHVTSTKAIKSIFDDALFGRRTLINLYLPFTPAALYGFDVLNGDVDVVCLAPCDIDPIANGDITITFDLVKLIQNHPSAFYKQRDLEYGLERKRQVKLGGYPIIFDHTKFIRYPEETTTYLTIFDLHDNPVFYAKAPKSSFISYNLRQIHEVLTLNFFRFIDLMYDSNGKYAETFIRDFYGKVAALSDEALVDFLTEIEKGMTDTAEFNFYGAHQIDFSTVIEISKNCYISLNLTKFINALRQGDIDELQYAQKRFPTLFQSYRFLDYLLSQVQNSKVRCYLDDLRKQCSTPTWVKYTPLSVTSANAASATNGEAVPATTIASTTTTTTPSQQQEQQQLRQSTTAATTNGDTSTAAPAMAVTPTTTILPSLGTAVPAADLTSLLVRSQQTDGLLSKPDSMHTPSTSVTTIVTPRTEGDEIRLTTFLGV